MKQFLEKQKSNYSEREFALKKNRKIVNSLQSFLEDKELHKHFPGKHIPWFSYQMKNENKGTLKLFLKRFKEANRKNGPIPEIVNNTCKKIYLDEKRGTIVFYSTIFCTSTGSVLATFVDPFSIAKAIPIGVTFGCFSGLTLGIALANYFYPTGKGKKVKRKEQSL